MITRRTFTASLLSAVPATGLLGRAAFAQDMRDITFVQPSPSAINSFPVFTAIGEGFFAEEGLNVTVEAINGSGAVLQALSAGQAHFGRPGPGPLLAARTRGVEAVRVATCQLQARQVADYDEFMRAVQYFVDVASDYESDFIVFPELFTLMLLSFEEKELSPVEAIERLSEYTPRLRNDISEMAMRFNINIIAGSHPTRMEDGDIHNVAYVCLRDGAVHAQEKIHPTPNERYWWNIKGGDKVEVIQTDCGPIGVLICYDSEFPELARRLVDEGARIIFVPFCTDSRQGYMRVRYCAQARAIENQCFTVLSGNVGNLPNVANMDIQYAQSCILTPCDFPFARDGIAAEASENVETLTISDINLADLSWARAEGTVRNLADRRFDLYRIEWDEDGKHPGKPRPRREPLGPAHPGGG